MKKLIITAALTGAQHGKEALMSVMTEEYYMLTPAQERGGLEVATSDFESLDASVKMNLTPHVADNKDITLDVDLEYSSSIPQGRSSGLPVQKSKVFSSEVSIKDGDSVIFLKPEKTSNGQGLTREAVIVTANLIQDKPKPPVAMPSEPSSEFTLPSASRFKVMPVNPWVLSEQDALSTFALDVDTASYALCRQYIQHGFLPPAGAVRMEEFVNAFEEMANLATKAGVEGNRLIIHTPLIDLSKADIIRQGSDLGVDYGLTVSCYQADDEGRACGVCDSCRIRAAGFEAAGISDPTHYKSA